MNYETVKELTVTGAITDAEYALLFRFIAGCIEPMVVGEALVISLRRPIPLEVEGARWTVGGEADP